MNSKKIITILLLFCILSILPVSIYSKEDKKDGKNGIYFEDPMRYKNPTEFDEYDIDGNEEVMQRFKSMKKSGAWRLDEYQMNTTPDGEKEEKKDGERVDNGQFGGERVSNDTFEISKGMGPLTFPLDSTKMKKFSSLYGRRSVRGGSKNHRGLDMSAPSGTEIYAAYDGKVSFSSFTDATGNTVKIQHKNGVETCYFHMNKPSNKKVGDIVKAGDLVGYVGTTGHSTGPHLHFEVRVKGLNNGDFKNSVNPLHGFIDPNIKGHGTGDAAGGFGQAPPKNPAYPNIIKK